MPPVHFFTDSAGLQPQTLQQRYGPVDGQENAQYRVTCLFSSTVTQKAYAVCSGKVFAQEVGGRINLVLLPSVQPPGLHAPVRYYVYKGLRKNSIVDPTDANLIAAATNSDLTKAIHEAQSQRNTERNLTGASAPKATINAVGLNRTTAATGADSLQDTDFLDSVFQRLDADEYPTVTGGTSLGEFDPASIGFEIILDALGEGPRVGAVRASETIISALGSLVTDADHLLDADHRERILDYIDPCAFYAAFFLDGVHVKAHASDAKFAIKRRDALHSAVLVRFATSDTVYVDLRNEHDHGLDYYREYRGSASGLTQFQISLDSGAGATADYEFDGWPIYAVPVSAFTGADAKKPGTIRLRLPGGPNTRPLVHRGQGYFYTGFRRTNHPPDVKETLRPDITVEQDGFTVNVAFSIPKLTDNTVIPGYVNLRYLKRMTAPAPANPPPASVALEARHFFDNLFELTHLFDAGKLKIPFATNDLVAWHVTGEKAFVDETSGYGQPYMARVGVGRDPSNVYFFACTEQASLATGSAKQGTVPLALAQRHFGNIEFGFMPIVDPNNVTRPVLTGACVPSSVIEPPTDRSLNIDPTSMIVLALDKDELAAIATAASGFHPTLDKRLVLRNATSFPDRSGNTAGIEYSLFVAGYKLGTAIAVASTDTNLKVRNLGATPRLFSTADAALNFNGLSGTEQNIRHFKRSRTVLDVDWGLRQGPDASAGVIARTEGRVVELEIIGKVLGAERNWYLVNIPRPVITGVPANTRCWIGRGAGFYPVASCEKFICDLAKLQTRLDAAQTTPDTLAERITRLRQMTKEFVEKDGDLVSLGQLFDEVIGAKAPPPVVRLDEVAYSAGAQETTTGPAGETVTVDTDIQLFRDYMGVELGRPGQGLIVDLHHLFVGLDVVGHAEAAKSIKPGRMFVDPANQAIVGLLVGPYDIGNNVETSTWAGDIGAAPPDWDEQIDEDYQDRLENDKTLTDEERDFKLLIHYYLTRAGVADLYPDVFAHLLGQQVERKHLRDSSFRNVAAALYHFNRQFTAEGHRAAFAVFFASVGLTPTTPFRDQTEAVTHVRDAIRVFSDLWWIRRNPVEVLSGMILDDIKEKQKELWWLADVYANTFVTWLEQHK